MSAASLWAFAVKTSATSARIWDGRIFYYNKATSHPQCSFQFAVCFFIFDSTFTIIHGYSSRFMAHLPVPKDSYQESCQIFRQFFSHNGTRLPSSCCIEKPSSGHAATLNPCPHSLTDITLTRCLACTNWKCMSCRYGRLPTKLYYMQQILIYIYIYTYIVFYIDVAAVYVVLSTCVPPHK